MLTVQGEPENVAIQRPAPTVEQSLDRPSNRTDGRSTWQRLDGTRIAGPILLLGLWQILSTFVLTSSLPAPLAVAQRIHLDFLFAPTLAFYGLTDTGFFWSMLYTAENVALAVGLGSALGIATGLMTARSSVLRAIIDPIVLTAGTVPMLILAPFFLIWFGIGRGSAVALVVFYVAVILHTFAQRAANNLDPVYEDSARTLGASPRRIFRDILLPGTLPMLLGGIRIALAGAWGMEAISELLGAQQGVGKIVQVLAGVVDIEGIFAALIVLGAVAFAADALTALFISRVASWNVASHPQGV